MITEAHGIPLPVSLTGGNRNDITQLMPLIAAIPPVRGRRGRPRRRPKAVYADRGYDHDKYRRQVRGKGITPVIARRGTEHGSGLGVHRWVVEQSIALLHWFRRLAVLACATLVLTGFGPGLAVSLVIFAASAAFGSYQIAANTAFVARVPAACRARAFGVAAAGVVVGQGAGFILAGAAAELVAPATVIAVAGALGAVTAIALTRSWRQAEPAGGRHAARPSPGRAAAPRPAARRIPAAHVKR